MESFRSRRPYALTWDPEFSNCHPQRSAAGHQPLMTPKGDADTELTSDEIINNFINHGCDDDLDRYRYRKQTLLEFVKGVDIRHLRDVKSPLVSPARALMVDQETSLESKDTQNEVKTPPVTSAVTLAANQLFSKLEEHRGEPFNDDRRTHRRLIYVADLDADCMLALAATVPRVQAASLRDFCHKHLAFRSLIGGEISFSGAKSFSLEFHLPFYAWRTSPTPAFDHRQRGDGSSLRRSESAPRPDLLSNEECSPDLEDCIYEANVSVMVTGVNDWCWTAYGFVDIYFKSDVSNETVEHYQGKRLDAFSAGRYSIQSPIWNPREYYLMVLEARMAQVTQEYSNTTFRLIQLSEPYSSAFTRDGLRDVYLVELTQSRGFKWTIRMLRQMSHLLSKTINSWDTFNNEDIGLFCCSPASNDLVRPAWGAYLTGIDRHVAELRDLRNSLQHHTELFENMANSLFSHAGIAEARTVKLQSAFIQVLTIIIIFYLPASLASAIFSMQLPLITEDVEPKHYVLTLLAITLITVIIVIQNERIMQCILFVKKQMLGNNLNPTSAEPNRIWRKTNESIQRMEASWVDRFGAAVVDRYFEQVPGSIQALLNDLPLHVRQPPVRRGLARLFAAFFDAINCMLSAIVPRRQKDSSEKRPNPSDVEDGDRASTTLPSISGPTIRSILLCISRLRSNYHKTVMLPVDLTLIKDDEALFRALKMAYRRKIGVFQWWFCMRTIISIKFVHFEVDKESLVDIKYSSCEDKKVLEAFPPEDHPDYLYLPKPIGLVPPIGHNLLLTMYHAPKNGTGRKGCMSRIPKYRLDKVPLRVEDGLGNAWGLELVEGRRWEAFWYIAALIFLCSTAIALGYGLIKKDISAGFTIAGFLETSFGVGIAIATISATADYFS